MVYIRYDHRRLPLEKKGIKKHQPSDSVNHSDEILPSLNSNRRSEELFDGYLGEGRFNHARKINYFKEMPRNALNRYETENDSESKRQKINIHDNDNYFDEKNLLTAKKDNFQDLGSLNNVMRKIEDEKNKRQQDRMSEEFAEIKTRVSNILSTFCQSCSNLHKNLLNSQDIILHSNNSQQYRISEILATYSELCIDREDILRNVFFSSIDTNCEKQLQDSILENVEDISSEISTAMEDTNTRLKILQKLFKKFIAMRYETNLFQISKKKDREMQLKKLVTEQFKKFHKLKLEQKEKLDTWKFAANEVVEVLRSVRQEGLADFQRLEEEFLKLVKVFNTQKEVLEDTTLKFENHKITMQKLLKEKEINKLEHANLQDEYERCRMNLKSAQKKCTNLEITLNDTILKCTSLEGALKKATDIADQLSMHTKDKNVTPDTLNPFHQSNDKLEKAEKSFIEEKKKSKVFDLKLKKSSNLIDYKTETDESNYHNEIFNNECSKCAELYNKITLLNAEIVAFKHQNFENKVFSSQQTENTPASFEDKEILEPHDNQFLVDGCTQTQFTLDDNSDMSNQSQIQMENKSSLVQPFSKDCVLDVSTQTQPFDITFKTDCRNKNISTSTCDLIRLNCTNEQVESTLEMEILSLSAKIKDLIKNNNCLMKKKSEPLINISTDSKKGIQSALVNSQNSVSFKQDAVGINFENIADIPSFYRPICEQEPLMQRKWTESGFFEESNSTNNTTEKNKIDERKSVTDLPSQILHFLSESAKNKCSHLSDKTKALITQDMGEKELATKELYVFAEHAIDLLHTVAFVLSQTQGKNCRPNVKIKLPEIKKNQKYENMSSTTLASKTKREQQAALSSTSKTKKNKQTIKLPDIQTPNRQSSNNTRHLTSEVKKKEKMVLERKRKKIFSRHKKMIEKLRASGVGMKQIYTILGISYSNDEADFLEENSNFELSRSSSPTEALDTSKVLSTSSNYQLSAKTAPKQLDNLTRTIETSTYMGKFESKKGIHGKSPQSILHQFNTADNARLIFPSITSKASAKEDFFTNNFFNTKGLNFPRR